MLRSPDELRGLVEGYLDELVLTPELGSLGDSMRYALAGGGKRIRPVLCLATGDAVGAAVETLLPAAAAVELVHTFSLVHDDLPALDDDAERRGRASTWAEHGEATAILAGDALLAEALRLALAYPTPAVARELVGATLGMIGGQQLDLEARSRPRAREPPQDRCALRGVRACAVCTRRRCRRPTHAALARVRSGARGAVPARRRPPRRRRLGARRRRGGDTRARRRARPGARRRGSLRSRPRPRCSPGSSPGWPRARRDPRPLVPSRCWRGEFVSRLGSAVHRCSRCRGSCWSTTGSPTRMGLVFAAELVPIAISASRRARSSSGSAPARRCSSRTPRACRSSRAIPLLHELGGLSFGLILVLAALSGLFSTAYFTCQRVDHPGGRRPRRAADRPGEQPDRGDDEPDEPGRPGAGRRPDRTAGRGERDVARRGFVRALVPDRPRLRTRRRASASSPSESRRGLGRAGATCAGIRSWRARLSQSLAFGFLFPILFASFPVLAFEQYHQNARIAGLARRGLRRRRRPRCVAAYRLLGKVPPLKLASFALAGLSLPMWVLVPHAPRLPGRVAMALVGFSNPIVNAPIFGLLATRVPQAFQPKVIQTLVTANTLAGAARLLRRGAAVRRHRPACDLCRRGERAPLLASLLFIHAVVKSRVELRGVR